MEYTCGARKRICWRALFLRLKCPDQNREREPPENEFKNPRGENYDEADAVQKSPAARHSNPRDLPALKPNPMRPSNSFGRSVQFLDGHIRRRPVSLSLLPFSSPGSQRIVNRNWRDVKSFKRAIASSTRASGFLCGRLLAVPRTGLFFAARKFPSNNRRGDAAGDAAHYLVHDTYPLKKAKRGLIPLPRGAWASSCPDGEKSRRTIHRPAAQRGKSKARGAAWRG